MLATSSARVRACAIFEDSLSLSSKDTLDYTPQSNGATSHNLGCGACVRVRVCARAEGIDEVMVYCVNDPAVMGAWAKDQKIAGSIVSFFCDQSSTLTKALDVELIHEGPMRALGTRQCVEWPRAVAAWVELSRLPSPACPLPTASLSLCPHR